MAMNGFLNLIRPEVKNRLADALVSHLLIHPLPEENSTGAEALRPILAHSTLSSDTKELLRQYDTPDARQLLSMLPKHPFTYGSSTTDIVHVRRPAIGSPLNLNEISSS